jgi:predicted PurR-regulated permease PerM
MPENVAPSDATASGGALVPDAQPDEPDDAQPDEPDDAQPDEPDEDEPDDAQLRARRPRPPRYGRPGMPLNRAQPFYLGFVGALGVLVAWGLVQLLGQLSQVLTLLVIALFLALGLDPLVRALQRRGLGRPASVAIVFVGVIAVFVGFVAAVAPPVVRQATELSQQAPDLVDTLLRSDTVRRLDAEYGVVSRISDELQKRLSSGETVVQLFGGVLGAGRAVLSGFFSTFTVLVLTLYLLASLRGTTEAFYRMVPASRRDRVRLLGDEIIRRIGGYVAGQVGIATINGVCTLILLTILGLDYSVVLAITVALFGLIPLVGASIGAVIVVLVALFDSWQYGVIVAAYYLAYQQVENYVIAPRVMARTVSVPGAVALVAALAGGSLLGILGAVIAIPIAAAVLLIVKEVVVPRQQAL